MKQFNVLITGAGTTTAITVLKALRSVGDQSIQLFMGDPEPNCAGAYLGDQYICMPFANDPEFEKKISEICTKHRINLVIPIIDYEFMSWSRMAQELLTLGVRVVISKPNVIEICGQKDLTIEYFNKIGAPCPATWRVQNISDPDNLSFPLFIKPRRGRASLNTQQVNNVEEYLYYSSKENDLIVQPLLSGDEVSIDTLSDFKGNFLSACPRIRVEVKNGQAYRSLTTESPELVDYAKSIVEGLPIIGPANIQCFLTDRGPQFIEINPRFGAGTILSIKAGLNGPAALVNIAREKNNQNLKPRPNVWMFRYWQEVFVDRCEFPIFFDLDGPILDVSRRHYEVYRSILHEAHKPVIPYEQYWKEKRARRSHREVLSHTAGKDFYKSFTQQWFDKIEREDYLQLDTIWPWVKDVLADLYRKHDIYVITSRSNPERLRKQLDWLGLTRWFKNILCRPARQNAAHEKVTAIRERFLGVPPKGTIVGDTEADIECGKELGFITVGVLCGIRDKDHLVATKCDYLLKSIEFLPQTLNLALRDAEFDNI